MSELKKLQALVFAQQEALSHLSKEIETLRENRKFNCDNKCRRTTIWDKCQFCSKVLCENCEVGCYDCPLSACDECSIGILLNCHCSVCTVNLRKCNECYSKTTTHSCIYRTGGKYDCPGNLIVI